MCMMSLYVSLNYPLQYDCGCLHVTCNGLAFLPDCTPGICAKTRMCGDKMDEKKLLPERCPFFLTQFCSFFKPPNYLSLWGFQQTQVNNLKGYILQFDRFKCEYFIIHFVPGSPGQEHHGLDVAVHHRVHIHTFGAIHLSTCQKVCETRENPHNSKRC